MKPHVLQSALWTVAFAFLFFWLLILAANYHPTPPTQTIVHGKVCPAPTTPRPVGK